MHGKSVLLWFNLTSRIDDMNMTSPKTVGTIAPTKRNIKLECNREREGYRRSMRLEDIEEIGEEKLICDNTFG